MLTKIDKAWVAGAVSFAALTLSTLFEVEINPVMQGSIVGIIVMGMTYIVPNRT